MIEIPGFIDLHTHTRYPDVDKFPHNDIDESAINGGFSTLLAMPNSEIPIDSIKNLKIAQEIDKKLKTKVHRVGALTKDLDGRELVNYKEFIENGITIFLNTSINTLIERVSRKNKRPLFNSKNIKESINNMFNQRIKYYNQSRFSVKDNNREEALSIINSNS